MGLSQLNAVRSLLVKALLHGLKCEAWPLAGYVEHWRAQARGFRRDAARRFTPSMRQRIDVAELYIDALYQMSQSMDGRPPLPLATVCPVTLDELLGW